MTLYITKEECRPSKLVESQDFDTVMPFRPRDCIDHYLYMIVSMILDPVERWIDSREQCKIAARIDTMTESEVVHWIGCHGCNGWPWDVVIILNTCVMTEGEVGSWTPRRVWRGWPLLIPYTMRDTREPWPNDSRPRLRRAILELCALSMSSSDRDLLIGAPKRDGLSCVLREQKSWGRCLGNHNLGFEGHLMKQKWFSSTAIGQLHVLDGLYETIRRDPSVFLNLTH